MRKDCERHFLANLAQLFDFRAANPSDGASAPLLSLGEIQGSEESGTSIGSINPFEMSVDLGYSRKLSEKFSMGVVLRYIYSDARCTPECQQQRATRVLHFLPTFPGYFTTYPIIVPTSANELGRFQPLECGFKGIV